MYIQINDEKILMDFNNGILVKVGGPDESYFIECSEFPKFDDQSLHIDSYPLPKSETGERMEFNIPIEFYFDFEISVYKFSPFVGMSKIYSHRFNENGQLIKFILDTDNYDEAKLWVERIELYKKIRGCNVLINSKFPDLSDYFNTSHLTKQLHPYKTYRIGRYPKSSNDWNTRDPRKEGLIWFGYWKTFWSYQHPRCHKNLTSQEIIDDILGL